MYITPAAVLTGKVSVTKEGLASVRERVYAGAGRFGCLVCIEYHTAMAAVVDGQEEEETEHVALDSDGQ